MATRLFAGATDHEARIPMRAYVVVATHLVAVLMVAVWALATSLADDNAALTSVDDPGTAGGAVANGEAAADSGGQTPPPTGVRLPTVGIDTGTVPVGLEDDGSLEVPDDPHISGWWSGGAAPGEPGAAVIVGHVDSREGPGAFFRLGDLEPGERVTVEREDGTSVEFHVDRIERHPKAAFPTDAVYGQTQQPTLRLITCSGVFDRRERSYEDNTIVFLDPAPSLAREVADRTATRRPAPPTSRAEPVGSPSPDSARGDAWLLSGVSLPAGLGVPAMAAVLSLVGSLGGLVRQWHVTR